MPVLFLYGGKDELIPPRATAATWRALPRRARALAFYPAGYHLLMRDKAAVGAIDDVIAWIADPRPRCPRAPRRPRRWLAEQERERALPSASAFPVGVAVGPVAQLDRASPSEGEGRTFESCRVRQSGQHVTDAAARVPEGPG